MSGLAKYHDELAELMSKHKGKTFCRKEIIDMFEEAYPSLRSDFVQPSDHCIDHECEQDCECAGTEEAIFSYPAKNTYIVL